MALGQCDWLAAGTLYRASRWLWRSCQLRGVSIKRFGPFRRPAPCQRCAASLLGVFFVGAEGTLARGLIFAVLLG